MHIYPSSRQLYEFWRLLPSLDSNFTELELGKPSLSAPSLSHLWTKEKVPFSQLTSSYSNSSCNNSYKSGANIHIGNSGSVFPQKPFFLTEECAQQMCALLFLFQMRNQNHREAWHPCPSSYNLELVEWRLKGRTDSIGYTHPCWAAQVGQVRLTMPLCWVLISASQN